MEVNRLLSLLLMIENSAYRLTFIFLSIISEEPEDAIWGDVNRRSGASPGVPRTLL